jgi:hypothetical protein
MLLCNCSRIHIKESQVRCSIIAYLVDNCEGINVKSSTTETKLPTSSKVALCIDTSQPGNQLQASKPLRAVANRPQDLASRWRRPTYASANIGSYRSVAGTSKNTVSRLVVFIVLNKHRANTCIIC